MKDPDQYSSNACRLWQELDTFRDVYLADALARGELGEEAFSKAAHLSMRVFVAMQPHLKSGSMTDAACAEIRHISQRLGQ